MPTRKRILVVEDERPLTHAIGKKWQREGFNVVAARSVREGLQQLKKQDRIDVIWLDHYLLGKEDGLDFVAKVKGNATWKRLPIFLVSNTASATKVKSYLHLGVKKYYVKAEKRLDDIVTEIKNYLNRPKNRD